MSNKPRDRNTKNRGKITRSPGAAGQTEVYTYSEGDRFLVVEWDPRNGGDAIYLNTAAWTQPAGEPIDDGARKRIQGAFLAFSPAQIFDEWYRPPRKLR